MFEYRKNKKIGMIEMLWTRKKYYLYAVIVSALIVAILKYQNPEETIGTIILTALPMFFLLGFMFYLLGEDRERLQKDGKMVLCSREGLMTWFLMFISLVIGLVFFISFESYTTMKEPPELTVKSGDIEINNLMGLNMWKDEIYDRRDSFPILIEEPLEYIKIGQEITMTFDKRSVPDEYALYDIILWKSGNRRYNILDNEIKIDFVEGEASFILPVNMAALLSSNSRDYEEGAVFRGFKLICKWEEDEVEYAFIIRSDAFD